MPPQRLTWFHSLLVLPLLVLPGALFLLVPFTLSCQPVATMRFDANAKTDDASTASDAENSDGATKDIDSAPDHSIQDIVSSDTPLVSADAAIADIATQDASPDGWAPDVHRDIWVADTTRPDTARPDTARPDSTTPDRGPWPAPDFTATDQNPNSPTYNQSRTLSDNLGKVTLLFFVTYT